MVLLATTCTNAIQLVLVAFLCRQLAAGAPRHCLPEERRCQTPALPWLEVLQISVAVLECGRVAVGALDKVIAKDRLCIAVLGLFCKDKEEDGKKGFFGGFFDVCQLHERGSVESLGLCEFHELGVPPRLPVVLIFRR